MFAKLSNKLCSNASPRLLTRFTPNYCRTFYNKNNNHAFYNKSNSNNHACYNNKNSNTFYNISNNLLFNNRNRTFYSTQIQQAEESQVAPLDPRGLSSLEIAESLRQVQISSREHSAPKQILPYRIVGNETTIVEIDLQPNEGVRAETGCLVCMETGIEIETSVSGIQQGLMRFLTSASFFVSDFVNRGTEKAVLTLSAAFPAKIIPIRLEEHAGRIICAKNSFIAGSSSTQFGVHATNMLSGIFGGEGFLLQELTGNGFVLLKAGGTLIHRELKEGETLRASAGNLIAFESSVNYNVQRVPGIKNMLFGANGLVYVSLTGPGKVWLQSMPFERLASAIAPYVPRGGGGVVVGAGGGGGGSGSSTPTEGTGDGSGAATGGTAETGGQSEFSEDMNEAASEPELISDAGSGDDDGSSSIRGFFSSLFGIDD